MAYPDALRLPTLTSLARSRPAQSFRNQQGFREPTGRPPQGFTGGFDYGASLQGDPLFSQTRTDLGAQGVANASQRGSGFNQLLGQFGEIPNLTNALTGLGLDPNSALYRSLQTDIDPRTAQAAQSLTDAGYSTIGGLQRQHGQNVAETLHNVGSITSGATGSRLNKEDERYGMAQYDARKQLLDQLAGLQNTFAQGQQDIQGKLADAASQAASRKLAPYLNAGVAPSVVKQAGF